MIQITFERAFAGGGQTVIGARHTPIEALGDADVAGFLEFAGVDAQIAIGAVEQFLQFVESEGIVDGKGTQQSQAQPLVNQLIELGRFAEDFQRGTFFPLFANCVLSSRHISPR